MNEMVLMKYKERHLKAIFKKHWLWPYQFLRVFIVLNCCFTYRASKHPTVLEKKLGVWEQTMLCSCYTSCPLKANSTGAREGERWKTNSQIQACYNTSTAAGYYTATPLYLPNTFKPPTTAFLPKINHWQLFFLARTEYCLFLVV